MTVIMLPDSERKNKVKFHRQRCRFFTLLDGFYICRQCVLCKMHSKSDEKVIAVIKLKKKYPAETCGIG